MTSARHKVNLLYITADETSHYVLAKELTRLVLGQYNNNYHKTCFYQYCLHGCTSEDELRNHLERCKVNTKNQAPRSG